MTAILASVAKPLRIPSSRPGVHLEFASEALCVGSIGVSVRAVRAADGATLATHGFVVPVADPFGGVGCLPPDEVARAGVALLQEALIVREWRDAAPDWEMFDVLRGRMRRMAVRAAGGSSIG